MGLSRPIELFLWLLALVNCSQKPRSADSELQPLVSAELGKVKARNSQAYGPDTMVCLSRTAISAGRQG